MKIACLGWGSLIWRAEKFPIKGEWFEDGPFVPVELTRQSNDGRITLVIDPISKPLRVLWAQMIPTDLNEAIIALQSREETTLKNIGHWEEGQKAPDDIPKLPAWAQSHGLNAVIWTNLRQKFNKKNGCRPTIEEVLEYLKKLEGNELIEAKRYIEFAPRQINTLYRQRIEAELGWLLKL